MYGGGSNSSDNLNLDDINSQETIVIKASDRGGNIVNGFNNNGGYFPLDVSSVGMQMGMRMTTQILLSMILLLS